MTMDPWAPSPVPGLGIGLVGPLVSTWGAVVGSMHLGDADASLHRDNQRAATLLSSEVKDKEVTVMRCMESGSEWRRWVPPVSQWRGELCTGNGGRHVVNWAWEELPSGCIVSSGCAVGSGANESSSDGVEWDGEKRVIGAQNGVHGGTFIGLSARSPAHPHVVLNLFGERTQTAPSAGLAHMKGAESEGFVNLKGLWSLSYYAPPGTGADAAAAAYPEWLNFAVAQNTHGGTFELVKVGGEEQTPLCRSGAPPMRLTDSWVRAWAELREGHTL